MDIIWGTVDAVKLPGTTVPSSEHQQFGRRHSFESQGNAPFGSFRTPISIKYNAYMCAYIYGAITNRLLLTAPATLVGAVGTVDTSVAKVRCREARAVAASQMSLLAVTVLEKRSGRSRLCKTLKKFQITIRSRQYFSTFFIFFLLSFLFLVKSHTWHHVAVVDVRFEVAHLPGNVEQQSLGASELEHLVVCRWKGGRLKNYSRRAKRNRDNYPSRDNTWHTRSATKRCAPANSDYDRTCYRGCTVRLPISRRRPVTRRLKYTEIQSSLVHEPGITCISVQIFFSARNL